MASSKVRRLADKIPGVRHLAALAEDHDVVKAQLRLAEEKLEVLGAGIRDLQEKIDDALRKNAALELEQEEMRRDIEVARQVRLADMFAREGRHELRDLLLATEGTSILHEAPASQVARKVEHGPWQMALPGVDRMSQIAQSQHGWALAEVNLLASLLQPGDVAVDVGANVGFHAVPMAARIGERGVVVCIEPNPICVELLLYNLRQNGCPNAVVAVAGAADRRGSLDLWIYRESLGHASMERTSMPRRDAVMRVPTFTIDEIVAAAVGSRRIRLVKLDLQGFEPVALAGAAKTMRAHRPICFAEYDRRMLRAAGHDAAWPKAFLADGYRMFLLGDRIPDPQPVDLETLVSSHHDELDSNLLLIHKDDPQLPKVIGTASR